MPNSSSAATAGPLVGVAAAALLCLGAVPVIGAGPARAASCHMTVQGVPVVDDRACSTAGRPGDVRVAVGSDDAIRIRRSVMTGRFVVRRPSDGRLRRITVNYGLVLVSSDSGDKTCYFNQKATLCVDP